MAIPDVNQSGAGVLTASPSSGRAGHPRGRPTEHFLPERHPEGDRATRSYLEDKIYRVDPKFAG
jgi:hypothetical protein